MKVAVTVNEPDSLAGLERRFARCAYYLIFDSLTKAWRAEANPAVEASSGAGTRAAQFLADHGVEAVISGEYGPKALRALNAAEIKPYSASAAPAEKLFKDLLAGELQEVESGGAARSSGLGA
jgi:predicted Fe-Mo cluster-binding NifX family protein